jgi:hypothetical protein
MSETETHFGKLRKVVLNEGYTVEDWCREKCEDAGYDEIASYNESWVEQFRDTFHEKYFIVDDEIWEAVEHIENGDSDIDVMLPNEDGTITFVHQFYNGGTCLSEVIEEGIQKLKKDGNI